MEASTLDKGYRDWRDAVDRRLVQIYCITIDDAGFDEEYLINQWQSNEAPFDFVEWFGSKYNLDPIRLLVSGRN
ncbi:MAG: hypothetical protein E7813_04255 [Bradyrhizobium sp.]|uniref:hypothetical protein n=1 Tax=Bradyrhizobium sp. TaxID=376 RepID=UPI001206BB3D|nr:hypothetical protein [Bradyrhizobium sp.]THD72229.1 MAG: hypothetical protein E7813_04255 [Bradyrhizobium sp.]